MREDGVAEVRGGGETRVVLCFDGDEARGFDVPGEVRRDSRLVDHDVDRRTRELRAVVAGAAYVEGYLLAEAGGDLRPVNVDVDADVVA